MRLSAAALLPLLVLAGCGGGGSDNNEPTPTPIPQGLRGDRFLRFNRDDVFGTVQLNVTQAGGVTGFLSAVEKEKATVSQPDVIDAAITGRATVAANGTVTITGTATDDGVAAPFTATLTLAGATASVSFSLVEGGATSTVAGTLSTGTLAAPASVVGRLRGRLSDPADPANPTDLDFTVTRLGDFGGFVGFVFGEEVVNDVAYGRLENGAYTVTTVSGGTETVDSATGRIENDLKATYNLPGFAEQAGTLTRS